MAISLLAAGPEHSWRGWIRDKLGRRDLILLDPASAEFGPAARICLIREEKAVAWRFTGSLLAPNNPITHLSGLHSLIQHAKNPVIQLPPLQRTPVARQLIHAIAQSLRPDQLILNEGSEWHDEPWPIGPESVALEKPLPAVVHDAQRRARWIELLDQSHEHIISLHKIPVQESRLGSGIRVQIPAFDGWAEICGGTLLMLSRDDITDAEARKAMDFAHAQRIEVVSPDRYQGLLCSLAHQDGADFSLGVIQDVQPEAGHIVVKAPAIPPAPIRILKIGRLRLDHLGVEQEEARPWTV